jgi:hypothetical protein
MSTAVRLCGGEVALLLRPGLTNPKGQTTPDREHDRADQDLAAGVVPASSPGLRPS